MATTHVFIVDSCTFKYHLEYMFAGTGAKDNYIDFNNSGKSKLHHTTENNLLGMIADTNRIRIGDYIIFYLQQNFSENIFEGKFYGVFKVKNYPFLDNNDKDQYLNKELNKSLTFRTLIEAYQVYSNGVTEWEALDEIKGISAPNQMLWSLIYRKLKGNRGNTMITIYESERLINLIRTKNKKQPLNSEYFSFNKITQQIEISEKEHVYKGRKEEINILPRLIAKYSGGKQFETHLQAYILANIESMPMFSNEKVEWLGNEVSCGVGMQRIDIMLSVEGKNRKLIPIELKSTYAYENITTQVQRYIDWIEQYYLSNRPSDIEPMIISREIEDKSSQYFQDIIKAFKGFNIKNNTLPLRYIEFSIDCKNKNISFSEVSY